MNRILLRAIIMTAALSSMAYSFAPLRVASTRRIQPLEMVGDPASIKRRNVCIPLLDLLDSEYADTVVTPLPSAHLPTDLSTMHLYGMELVRPAHKMLVEEAIQSGEANDNAGVYGYLVSKNNNGSLVGAIGCTAEILVNAKVDAANATTMLSEVGDDVPIAVLYRGSYRFIVKEVIKTFPYPVVMVDELLDDPPDTVTAEAKAEEEDDDKDDDEKEDEEESDDDDEDDDDIYETLDADELVRRTMRGLHTLIDQQLTDQPAELSPLEISILNESGAQVDPTSRQSQAEEMAAVLQVFESCLVDIAPTEVDRYYAIGMMAAELANVDNDMRRKILTMTDGVARLRVILPEIEAAVSMNQARKMANTITDELDEDMKNLKVGEPQLPQWANSITDGTRVEYFWSEVDGWCQGVVTGDPVKILDELVVTVLFDDGETHKLPFNAEEKVRWRPPQNKK